MTPHIEYHAKRLLDDIKNWYRIERYIAKLPAVIQSKATPNGPEGLDFDYLTRAEVLTVMKFFRVGKWEKQKSSSGEYLDYTGTLRDGTQIRLYQAAPPDSCRIIEEEVIVPAQPEKTVTVRRLVCAPEQTTLKAELALAPAQPGSTTPSTETNSDLD